MTVLHPRAAWEWRHGARRGALLWKAAALAGALALVAEWAIYGRARRAVRHAGPMVLRRPAARVAEVRR